MEFKKLAAAGYGNIRKALQAAADKFPQALDDLQAISALIAHDTTPKASIPQVPQDLPKGAPFLSCTNLLCLAPRSRLRLEFCESDLILHLGKRGSFAIALSNIESWLHLPVFPSTTGATKQTQDVHALILKKGLPIGKQCLVSIPFQCSVLDMDKLKHELIPPKDASIRLNGLVEHAKVISKHAKSESELLSRMFSTWSEGKLSPVKPEARLFQSATGLPYVPLAILKTTRGVFYPLPNGMFFLGKPFPFCSTDNCYKIVCTQSSPRTCDFTVQLDPEEEGARSKEFCFGMIPIEEMERLQAYRHALMRRVQAEIDAEQLTGAVAVGKEEEEDSEFDPFDEAEGGAKLRKKIENVGVRTSRAKRSRPVLGEEFKAASKTMDQRIGEKWGTFECPHIVFPEAEKERATKRPRR